MNALQRDLKRLVPLAEKLGADTVAADCHRQHYHIQPPVGWLNDPNGLCCYDGAYHVFYQYSPFDASGGVKHWGHVRSTDLIHWEPLPVMLYPDQPFDCHGAYSGSALVENGALYLYYTGNVKHPGPYDYITAGRGHNLCLAVSRDGVTLDSKQCLMYNRDYPAGLSCHVRDPKVFAWQGQYYMVLGARTLTDRGEVLVLQSADKLHWNHINTLTTPEPFGYMWECPDLFCLDGQWYLLVSPQGIPCQNVYGCGYFALEGDWRTKDCTLGQFYPLDSGFDFYAPQTFADEPHSRRILLGWMGMPDAPYGNQATVNCGWQHCMTLPRVLTRRSDGRLLQQPAPELLALRQKNTVLSPGQAHLLSSTRFALQAPVSGSFVLHIAQGAELHYTQPDRRCVLRFTDPALSGGRTQREVLLDDACRSLDVWGDASSLEIFLNQSEAVFSTRYYPGAGPLAIRLDGAAASVYELE